MTIKAKITLWYTILLIVIVGLMLFFIFSVGTPMLENSTKDSIVELVSENSRELSFEDGELEIDEDFSFHNDGIYSLIFSEDEKLISGQMPRGVPKDIPLESGPLRMMKFDSGSYYLYDIPIIVDSHTIWIRGIASSDLGVNALSEVMMLALTSLPFILIIGALVGYLISRQAFAPIKKINTIADEINEGEDLSRRINIGKGKDEIHKLAATMDRMFSRLEKSFEDEKQFTMDVSHELRTPTSVIFLQCEYALENAKTEEEYIEALAVIKRQAKKMSLLVSQLLNFARLEQGLEKTEFSETDFSELVSMSCEELQIINDKITLHLDIQSGIKIIGNPSMLIILVSNLLTNAVRYGKEEGNIWVTLHEDKRTVKLSVRDEGIGIAPEEIDKIWNKFYQVDNSRSQKEENSLGLGLAMVQQISKIHKGEMNVESTLGEGSVFTFTIKNNELH